MKKPGALPALLLGKKGKGEEEDDEEEATAGCEEPLGEAFDAIREKDREGFIASMKAAIKSEE